MLIDRLTFDTRVVEAAEGHARATGEPREVVMARASGYAEEIVPAFNAYLYFRLGYAMARRVARLLYRVRLGYSDEAGLAAIEKGATVVFVMNHRSNMDYIVVGFLAADRAALSYAVGEWARIWPLRALVRSLGGYFVRRDSRDALYRRVLERYIVMATARRGDAGPLSRGRPQQRRQVARAQARRPDYMLRDSTPRRDLVFVPVGINYDRILEDRTPARRRRRPEVEGRGTALALMTSRFTLRNAWQMGLGRWYRFGYACVNFGTPISMRTWLAERGGDLRRTLPRGAGAAILELGTELIGAVGQVIPALPVPLVATVLLESEDPLPSLEIDRRTQSLARRIQAAGGHVYVPRTDEEYATAVGLRALVLRRLVEEREGGFAPVPGEIPVLQYYANSIRHLLPGEM